MKKLFGAFIFLSLFTVLISACAVGGNTATGPNPVHMDSNSFTTLSITIKKGESITLISDDVQSHIIANGTWDDSTPKPAAEPGAPKTNITVGGFSSGKVGPFNTAGTFKLYCTIHPGMKMTVIVK
ncbi:cupredoxin domain-containing protein [Dictyobacter kobayashii]|uniref:Blue (type 1) copper domain-containing protein n=1 Tax=Dictyobacter kobayashii TaxID=2014872 RepID=A0A402AES1_9CHLR|nr:plastocyanin/azurin family copper-binding protein [Dictyobacter kobayashii]GCE17617.1 hypothetical protein KDK_14170 [Dictyobacter kobayashii]